MGDSLFELTIFPKARLAMTGFPMGTAAWFTVPI